MTTYVRVCLRCESVSTGGAGEPVETTVMDLCRECCEHPDMAHEEMPAGKVRASCAACGFEITGRPITMREPRLDWSPEVRAALGSRMARPNLVDPLPMPSSSHVNTADCATGACCAYEDGQHCGHWWEEEPCCGCGCECGEKGDQE